MNIDKKIKRAALYIRVSTDRQAKEGDSLEAQESALLKYCKDNDYKVVDEYIDGGESGQKIKRTNLQRMLEDVKQDKVDIILMTKLDRWFRNIGDFYKVIEIIKAHNTAWKTIWEDYDTTTASGEFWLNMSLSMGQLEAKRTAERINEVFDYKYNIQKTVCSGKVPWGYKIDKDKHLIVDDDKKELVIKMFEYYIKTNNLNKTAKWLGTIDTIISTNALRKRLSNSIYIGKFRRSKTKEIIEGFAPPIIDEDIFYKVQNLLEKNVKNYQPDSNRKKHNSKPYIFTGLLICKECGGRLSGKTNANSSHYYNCRKHEKHICNNLKCINEKRLEDYMLKMIIPILSKRKIEILKIEKKEETIFDNSAKIKKKINKLTSLYLEDMIDKDYYTEQYNELTLELNKIQTNKNKKSKTIDYSYIDKILKSNFLDIYNSLDNLEKRRLWSSIIDRVELTNFEDIEIIVY